MYLRYHRSDDERQKLDLTDVRMMIRAACAASGGQSAWARKIGTSPVNVTGALKHNRPGIEMLAALGVEGELPPKKIYKRNRDADLSARPSRERLAEILKYDPATGAFVWKPRTIKKWTDRSWNRRHAGRPAGCLSRRSGYAVIGVDNASYEAHLLAWVMMTGSWPDHEIDHGNRIRSDNRWCNLRAATSAENKRNGSGRHGRTSQYRGVSLNTARKKWVANISCNYKLIYIGSFDNEIDAARAYDRAAMRFHGDFACLNFTTTQD